MESSKVYFSNLRCVKQSQNKLNKIKNLFLACNIENLVLSNDIVAVKIHFGEYGNDSYINPLYIRVIIDILKNMNSIPFVTDTGTLYNGKRSNSPNHIEIALQHGFNYTVINAPITIADGLRGKSENIIEINKKHFKYIKIGHDINEADSMIVLSHFKGHSMAGFGGALKNLAMGCASKSGKYEQHVATKPYLVLSNCICCCKCIKECPVNAIELIKNKIQLNKQKCISCGYCLTCSHNAIKYEYTEIKDFLEKMMEYSYGVIQQKNNRIVYINFLLNITPDCDCVSWSDAPITPDIGILSSLDPVALDQACYDLVNKSIGLKNTSLINNFNEQTNKFKDLNLQIDSSYQLEYAEKLGIGKRKYKIIEI